LKLKPVGSEGEMVKPVGEPPLLQVGLSGVSEVWLVATIGLVGYEQPDGGGGSWREMVAVPVACVALVAVRRKVRLVGTVEEVV
jgi:hypothetical protein